MNIKFLNNISIKMSVREKLSTKLEHYKSISRQARNDIYSLFGFRSANQSKFLSVRVYRELIRPISRQARNDIYSLFGFRSANQSIFLSVRVYRELIRPISRKDRDDIQYNND